MFSAFQIPNDKFRDPKWVNELVITYSPTMLANRVVLVAIAGILLTVLYRRFLITEADGREKFAILDLSSAESITRVDPEFVPPTLSAYDVDGHACGTSSKFLMWPLKTKEPRQI